MDLELTEGTDGRTVLRYLGEVEQSLQDAANQPGQMRYFAYFSWAAEAALKLRMAITAESIDRFILTPRFYELLHTYSRRTDSQTNTYSPDAPAAVMTLISVEIEAAKHWLQETIVSLRNEMKAWDHRMHLIAVDTNVFIHCLKPEQLSAKSLIGSDEHAHMIVPLAVVDELESLKKGNRRGEASRALKALYSWTEGGTIVTTIEPHGYPDVEPLDVQIVVDSPYRARLADADSEILSRVVRVGQLAGRNPFLVSNDRGMLARAKRAGLKAVYIEQASRDRT